MVKKNRFEDTYNNLMSILEDSGLDSFDVISLMEFIKSQALTQAIENSKIVDFV